MPGLARIGFINDAADPGAARFDALAEKAARSKGLTLVPMPVRDGASVEAAYVGLGAERPGALIVSLAVKTMRFTILQRRLVFSRIADASC
jgi:hypothetical protein